MKPLGLAAFALVLGASSQAQAIVGGSPDSSRPDVLLMQDTTLAGFRCTATLIAPNLVITARHCIGLRAVPAATTLCKGGATDEGAQSLPNYMGDVNAPPLFFTSSPSTSVPVLAQGKAFYDDASVTTCGHDIALIGLDRSIPGITPTKVRKTSVTTGDELIAMGFGWTDRMATVNATERMKGITHVLALGPTVYKFKPLGDTTLLDEPVAVAPGEIAVQGLTMTGDSGGPAFDADGTLVGLVSRGYTDALYGPGTFTAVAAHIATINAALIATGNPSLGDDGTTMPMPGADGGTPGTTPPAGQPDGGFPADDPPGSGGSSGGCSVSGTPASGTAAIALGIAAAFALARRRFTSSRRPRRASSRRPSGC